MIDIKRAVSGNNRVVFTHYKDNVLWYQTAYWESFPVPIEDIGNAEFAREEKALLLMRYMRKYNEELRDIKETHDACKCL